MGIRVVCPNGHNLHLKSFLAGQRGVCPECGAKFPIPGQRQPEAKQRVHEAKANGAARVWRASTKEPPMYRGADGTLASLDVDRLLGIPSNAPRQPDAIATAPEAMWHVRLPAGEQFGPAGAELMTQWLSDQRVPDNALVWREGWDDWRPAGAVFGEHCVPTAPQIKVTNPLERPMSRAASRSSSGSPATGSTAVGSRRLNSAKKRSNRRLLVALIVAVAVLVPAVIWVLVRQ